MAETNQTMFPSNASALTPNETKKPIMDIALSKVPEQDKDSDGLPMWVPLVAIIIALVVIALVVYFKRRGKYASLRDSLMPASNWRLSASSLGLMSDPADPTPHPITPLSTADSSRTTNWEQQFFDDDAVYRPSTTTTSNIGNGGGGYGVHGAAGQIGGGSQQIVSPTRLQLEFSPLRI